MKRLILSAILFAVVISISGCAAHQVKINVDTSYQAKEDTKVKVNKVTNKTGQVYELDVEHMLKIAFEKQLKEYKLLADHQSSSIITLDINILKYSEGNAFKRWVWASWGATELTIEAKLYNQEKKIGDLQATKKIVGGGLYSVGQWSIVFDTLAAEVIEDFQIEFKKHKSHN